MARRDDGDGLNGAHDVEYILAGFGLFAATPAGFGSYPDRGSADINAQPRARNRRETVGLSTLSRATYLLRAPTARLSAPPTYLLRGRAACE